VLPDGILDGARSGCHKYFQACQILLVHPTNVFMYIIDTLYRKYDLCIPRNETMWASFPISTFMYLLAIYIFPGLVYLFSWCKIDIPVLGIYKIAHRYMNGGNWEAEHYNSVLEIMRPHSFISGNT
jgi:hypothetical protein